MFNRHESSRVVCCFDPSRRGHVSQVAINYPTAQVGGEASCPYQIITNAIMPFRSSSARILAATAVAGHRLSWYCEQAWALSRSPELLRFITAYTSTSQRTRRLRVSSWAVPAGPPAPTPLGLRAEGRAGTGHSCGASFLHLLRVISCVASFHTSPASSSARGLAPPSTLLPGVKWRGAPPAGPRPPAGHSGRVRVTRTARAGLAVAVT
jgi:hypothetical protein